MLTGLWSFFGSFGCTALEPSHEWRFQRRRPSILDDLQGARPADHLLPTMVLRMTRPVPSSPAVSVRMKAVRSKDTASERSICSSLWERGVRYRIHYKDLPGKPDIYIPRLRLAIFVNGCFWHSHCCTKGSRLPKSNADFWKAKLAYNAVRDRKNAALLDAIGIEAVTFWECELRHSRSVIEAIARRYATSESTPKTQEPRVLR